MHEVVVNEKGKGNHDIEVGQFYASVDGSVFQVIQVKEALGALYSLVSLEGGGSFAGVYGKVNHVFGDCGTGIHKMRLMKKYEIITITIGE